MALRGRAHDNPRRRGEVQLGLRAALWPDKPHRPQQRYVLGSRRLWHGLFGGRGSGKTVALAQKVVQLALANPSATGLVLGRTGREISDKIVPAIQREFTKIRLASGFNLVRSWSQADQAWTLINGARILLRPYGRRASLKLVNGYNAAWAGLDEVEYAQVPAQEVVQSVFFALRAPEASLRCMAVVSSPNGMRGFPKLFHDAQADGSPRHYVVTATVYDNPYIDDDFIAALRAGSSTRQWKQEGLGQILLPSDTVFGGEYSEAQHVVPWTWRRGLPYVVGIDWGTTHAYFMFAQVLPDGTWVVAYEETHEETSRLKFREAIVKAVKLMRQRYGSTPYMFAADRAVKSENLWLGNLFGPVARGGIVRMDTRQEQDIARGLAIISSMLDPLEGAPKVLFSSQLPTRGPGFAGLRYSMTHYRWQRHADGTLTDRPWKDDITDHPIDALRYAIVGGAYDPDLHGGAPLPYVAVHQPLDFSGDGSFT